MSVFTISSQLLLSPQHNAVGVCCVCVHVPMTQDIKRLNEFVSVKYQPTINSKDNHYGSYVISQI